MILAIDQGTTGTTCLVVDDELNVLGRGYRELAQRFPKPGWVEHDPEEIWLGVLQAAEAALAAAGVPAAELAAIGIANQRETTVVWDRSTGRPVAPAIVWQDRRTAERCRELDSDLIRERTGLVPDPYFSATKLEWLLRDRPQSGLAFGTVDSWLVWRLTSGAAHLTDRTNASRTLLCSLATLDWDDELLALFGVERELLPEIVRLGRRRSAMAELLGASGCRSAGWRATSRQRCTGTGCHAIGRRQGDVRDRQLRARAQRHRAAGARARPAGNGGGRRLRARRRGARQRRRAAVAS